jgi:hypothetical protein
VGVIAVGIAHLPFASAQPSQKNGHWLLDGLKTLADEGALFDPPRVETILSLEIVPSEQQVISQPPDCSNAYADRSRIVVTHSSEPIWLKPSPEGVQDMKIPAFAINPAGVSGSPKFSFQQTEIKNCSGKFRLNETRQARLSIDGLPSFACFSREYLVQALHARHHDATDGVDLVDYAGLTNDEIGTNLQFWFRAGANCALSAEITQSTDKGYRYLRAMAKWTACKKSENRKFCAANGPISWSDGSKIDEMEQAAVKACGGLTSFYEAEPASGEVPRVIPRGIARTPCGDN